MTRQHTRRSGHRRPVKGSRRRLCRGKPRYRSLGDASATASHRAAKAGHDLYVYPCDACLGWHITSQSPEQYAAAQAGEWATASRAS